MTQSSWLWKALTGLVFWMAFAYAHAIPFRVWDPFPDTDGAICNIRQVVDIGQLTKVAGIYPLGAQLAITSADCELNRTVYRRTFVISFPPGYNYGTRELFTQVAVTRTRINADVITAGSIVAVKLSIDPYVLGYAESNGSAFKPYHAFRYDLGTGVALDLGTLAGPAGASAAYGGSIDGSVVVGTSTTGPSDSPGVSRAFRWTPALGMRDMGAVLSGGASEAHAANDDGTVVVGSTDVAFGVTRAFRWTLSNAATGAGAFVDLGANTLRALTTNSDGSIIAGQSSTQRAFRWTQASGAVDLGVLPGHVQSLATSMSADGSIVVGTSDPLFITTSFPVRGPLGSSGSRAFRWTATSGLQDLNALAAQAGLDMTGVTLMSAVSVAREGHVIGGTARKAGSNEDIAYVLSYEDSSNGVSPPRATFVSLEPTTSLPGQPGLSVSLSAASGTISTTTGTAQTTVTVSPSGGFTGSVSLSCSGLPANTACVFSPASLNVGAAAVNSTLTIRNTSQAVAAVGRIGLLGSPDHLSLVGVSSAFLLAGCLTCAGTRVRRRGVYAFAITTGVVFLVSCGGGGGGGAAGTSSTSTATPGAYSVNVTATGSGGVSATAVYSLLVQN